MRRSLFARVILARELLRRFEDDEEWRENFDFKDAMEVLVSSGLAAHGQTTGSSARWREAARKHAAQFTEVSRGFAS